MPRSSASNRIIEYSHSGRTVAIVAAPAGNASASSQDVEVWVEGEDSGVSPTQEVSPFALSATAGGEALPSDLFEVGLREAEKQQIEELRQEDPVFDIEEQVASLLTLHPGTSSAALVSPSGDDAQARTRHVVEPTALCA